eukprot:3817584-Rhodomonas_salina.2
MRKPALPVHVVPAPWSRGFDSALPGLAHPGFTRQRPLFWAEFCRGCAAGGSVGCLWKEHFGAGNPYS